MAFYSVWLVMLYNLQKMDLCGSAAPHCTQVNVQHTKSTTRRINIIVVRERERERKKERKKEKGRETERERERERDETGDT